MAAPSGQLRVGQYFGALLAFTAVVYALVFFTGDSATPKLGLDLQGGTTVTLQAKTDDGGTPGKSEMDTARQIIERRVNGLGVAEAEVVIEGNNRIVISVPGERGDQAKTLGSTAKLRFRPLVIPEVQAEQAPPSPSATPSGTPSGTPGASGSATPTPSASAKASGSNSGTPSGQPRPVPPLAADPTPSGSAPPATPPVTPPPDASQQVPPNPFAEQGVTDAQYQDAVTKYQALKCSDEKAGGADDDPKLPLAACSEDGQAKYLLAPSIIEGTEIKDADAAFDSQGLSGWRVVLDLKGGGRTTWAEYTSKHNAQVTPNDPANFVSFTLDGKVVSAPQIQGTINGQTEVTGSFNEDSAKELAAALKYGSLPLTFTQQEARTISPTLGTDQLKAGLLAGGIGLALVVLYTLVYYRALGLVTIASLVVSGVLVYGSVVLLGRYMGFTLTLAGIAGLIVSVGITADSFVVFFERLKDEVRDGRSVRSAVPRAWVRARRTILSADAVSFLAAAILYYLAAGAVKGFAFTLGLSTVIDLVVVFLFTHPFVSLVSRSKSFTSPRVSGLHAVSRPHAAAGATAGTASRTRLAKES